jgi:hypothetical protein
VSATQTGKNRPDRGVIRRLPITAGSASTGPGTGEHRKDGESGVRGLQCRNCGDPVDARRVELGYDYCLKEECQQRCLKPVQLTSVAVNKAADYYDRADDGGHPRPPGAIVIDGDERPEGASRASRPGSRKEPRPQTTFERLREQEVRLDEALSRSYQRFSAGEITAREMDRECDQLIGSFNQQVMAENIRYRSLLRRGSKRVR